MNSRDTLVLVPTERELKHVSSRILAVAPSLRLELCGLGPVAAAARTAQLLAEDRPARVILVGTAGSYDERLAPVGQAVVGGQVRLDGVGAGDGDEFLDVEAMGLLQWPGNADSPGIGSSLELEDPVSSGALLLTVCAASADRRQALRRKQRFPTAVAEEMEGFAVGFACALSGTPCTIVRGISNVAGDRDHENWNMNAALAAAVDLTGKVLEP